MVRQRSISGTVASDGDDVEPGDIVAWAFGPARQILTAERLALNFMQRMSGIATGTRRVVALLDRGQVRVCWIRARPRRAYPGF